MTSIIVSGDSITKNGASFVEWQLLQTFGTTSAVSELDIDLTPYHTDWDDIKILAKKITITNDGIPIYGDFSLDNGVSFEGGSDIGAALRVDGTTGAWSLTNSTSPFYIDICSTAGMGNAANEEYHAEITLFNPFLTDGANKMVKSFGIGRDDGGGIRGNQIWVMLSGAGSDAIDVFRITPSTGNIDNLDGYVYGRKAP